MQSMRAELYERDAQGPNLSPLIQAQGITGHHFVDIDDGAPSTRRRARMFRQLAPHVLSEQTTFPGQVDVEQGPQIREAGPAGRLAIAVHQVLLYEDGAMRRGIPKQGFGSFSQVFGLSELRRR
jgi:hypothetical protein